MYQLLWLKTISRYNDAAELKQQEEANGPEKEKKKTQHVTGKQGMDLRHNLFLKRGFKQWLIWSPWEREHHMNLGLRNKPNQERVTHRAGNVMRTKCWIIQPQ